MRQVTLSITVSLLLGLLSVPATAGSKALLSFPDPKVFEGIKVIMVAPMTFTNMENVNLAPETLRASMQDQLRNAAIAVFAEEVVELGARSGDRATEDVGLLAATVRQWETSGPMGTTMNSFAISLRFFQKAQVQPSQRNTWVITWLETKSVLVGTKRPKGIADALDELLQSFIREFKGLREAS